MIFVVEDGTGKPDATTLVDLDWADAHLASTGYAESWLNHGDDVRKGRLVTATGLIGSSFSWRGRIANEIQSLYFPRTGLQDREGRIILGIPPLVRGAVAELAFIISETNYIQDSELAAFESIKVGPIDIDLSASSSVSKIIPDSIIRALSEYGTYRFSKTRMRRLEAG